VSVADPRPGKGRLSLGDSYEAIHSGLVVFPLERRGLLGTGDDILGYLQGQVTADVGQLGVGESAEAFLLSPKGKAEGLVRLTVLAPGAVLIDFDSVSAEAGKDSSPGDGNQVRAARWGTTEAVLARLVRYRMRVRVAFEPVNWNFLGVRGEPSQVAELARDQARLGGDSAVVIGTEWPGLVGFDLTGPAPELFAEVSQGDPAALEAARIEAGQPRMGHEITEATIPAETGILARTVSFDKGCYTGQELVARLDARGSKVARHLRGITFEHPVIEASAAGAFLPRLGSELGLRGRRVGELTSVAWSPVTRGGVCLGYVHRDVEPGSEVEIACEMPSGSGGEVPATEGLVGLVRELPLAGRGA